MGLSGSDIRFVVSRTLLLLSGFLFIDGIRGFLPSFDDVTKIVVSFVIIAVIVYFDLRK